MIARLAGKIISKQPPEVIVDVNGVGYEVLAPMTTFYRLGLIGEEVLLQCHFVVREDAQQLYGFYQKNERDLFRNLIKVNGVGPKMALAILSTFEAAEFVRAVHSNDVAGIVAVPGVGKKTAERLLIEMRDRLKDWQVDAIPTALELAEDVKEQQQSSQIMQDAQSALVALGYKPTQAAKVVQQVYQDTMNCDQLIRAALKGM